MQTTRRLTIVVVAALLSAAIAVAGVAAMTTVRTAAAAGTAVPRADGNHHDWKTKVNYWDLQGGIPWHDESDDFCNALGVGHYNSKYWMVLDASRSDPWHLAAMPYRMAPDRPQRNGSPIVVSKDKSELPLCICDAGVPKQDVYVFTAMKDDNSGRLYYRQLSENLQTLHCVQLPSGCSTNEMAWNSALWRRPIASATQFQGAFATAWAVRDWKSSKSWNSRGQIRLITGLDLNRSSGAMWRKDAGGTSPIITTPGDKPVIEVALTSVTHGDREYLALACTYGDPQGRDPWPTDVYDINKNCGAFVRLYSYENGALNLVKDIAVPVDREPAWYLPAADGRDPASLYGDRGIAVLQGSVEGSGNGGDLLQIFTQNAARVDGAFDDQFVARYEYSLDSDRFVDMDYMFQTGRSAHKSIFEVNFLAFKSFELTKKKAYGDFDEYRQHLNVISTSYGDGGVYRGWLCDFPSDYLVPIEKETVNGGPVNYPVPVDSNTGATEGTLVGVVFGPPPFPLNGNAYKDATSKISFSQERSKETKTTEQIGGSFSVTGGVEIFGCGVTSTGSLGYDYQSGKSETTTKEYGWEFQHNAADLAQTGWMIGYYPSYLIQAFKRFDSGRKEVPGSHIYLTLPSGDAAKEIIKPIAFDMANPDRSPTSKGVAAHAKPSDFANQLWKKDPLEEAGRHGELIDQNSLSSTYGQLGWCSIGKKKTASSSHAVNFKINAKIKGPKPHQVEFEVHGGASKEETTSDTQNTRCDLSIATRPQQSGKGGAGQTGPRGASDTIVGDMSEIVYWMKAKDSAAYWIPDWARSGANDQTPWCVDYFVRDWTPKDSGGAGGASDQCAVGVVAWPAAGGDVAIAPLPGDVGQRDPVAVPIGGTARATAVPEEGYRFVRWRSAGKHLAIGSPRQTTTDIAVRDAGGATAVAAFAYITPTRLTVTRRGGDTCDIVMKGAPLPFALCTPAVGRADAASPKRLGLSIGGSPVVIPPSDDEQMLSPYQRPSLTAGGVFLDLGDTASASEGRRVLALASPWGAGSSVRVAVDPAAGTWGLTARGMKGAAQFLRQCAAGEVTVALTDENGEILGVGTQTVSTRAKLVSARLPNRLGGGLLPTAAGRTVKPAVNMNRATLVVKTPKNSGKTTLILSGVKLDKRLFNRRGIVIGLAGDRLIRVGRFKLRDGSWVWKGRSLQLYDVQCRYRNGRLTLGLSGPFLRADLDKLIAETVTLTVINGRRRASGAMLTTVKSLTRVTPIAPTP